MANTIQVRRGANASLPTLNAGEVGFSTDTYQIYVGDGVNNHEITLHDLFDANTILKADSDNTPAALTVVEQTLIGRITAGVITALTATQVRTLLNVADGADVTGSNPPQAHDLDSHNSCTLAELSADITDATLASIAGTETFTNKIIELDDALGVDHTYEGITTDDTVGESVVFGDLLYMNSDNKWWKGSSAVASSAECPIEAMAVATIAADAAGKLLLYGTARDDTWNFTTIGKVYVGVDVPTHTIPSTSGHTVQIIGTSLDADRMLFKPDSTYIELS